MFCRFLIGANPGACDSEHCRHTNFAEGAWFVYVAKLLIKRDQFAWFVSQFGNCLALLAYIPRYRRQSRVDDVGSPQYSQSAESKLR
jgi:hypothetical protein